VQRFSDYSIVSASDCMQRLDFSQGKRSIESEIVNKDCEDE